MDKRRMDVLRVEDGGKESFMKKLVNSRLKWAGHVERMATLTPDDRDNKRRTTTSSGVLNVTVHLEHVDNMITH